MRSLDISEMIKAGKHSTMEKRRREREREEKAKGEDERSATPTAEVDDDEFDFSSIELAVRQENAIIKTENKRLHDAMTELHSKYATISSEFIEIKENLQT